MLVPLSLLDPILRDEPALERDQLRVRPLHPLRGLDELLHRRRGNVLEDVLQQLLQPLGEAVRQPVGQARPVVVLQGAVATVTEVNVIARSVVTGMVVAVGVDNNMSGAAFSAVVLVVRVSVPVERTAVRELVQELAELRLRLLLLHIERLARVDEPRDRAAEAREVHCRLQRRGDALDPIDVWSDCLPWGWGQDKGHLLVEVTVKLESVVGRVEREDDGVGETERDETEVLRDSDLHEQSCQYCAPSG